MKRGLGGEISLVIAGTHLAGGCCQNPLGKVSARACVSPSSPPPSPRPCVTAPGAPGAARQLALVVRTFCKRQHGGDLTCSGPQCVVVLV